jgi:hypothetical protein
MSFWAQQSQRYSIINSGNMTGIWDNDYVSVNWGVYDQIIDDKDTTRFFWLPKSNLYDISLANGQSTYGTFIYSKANFQKSEALVYFGSLKSNLSERKVIDNSIFISQLSSLPYKVMVGSDGDFYLSKKNALRLGNTLLSIVGSFDRDFAEDNQPTFLAYNFPIA